MAPRLLLATTNQGKLREIRAMLASLAFETCSLEGFPELPPATEDGATFLENATRKATHFAALTGLLTLADDSGLEVDCLGGRPGVLSARFAGPACDPRANNARLIELLRGIPPGRRQARFRCAMVVAGPQGIVASAEGRLEGRIVNRARGRGGFGYDPHFLIPELNRTAAELAPGHKNTISHRGQALREIARQLAARLEQ